MSTKTEKGKMFFTYKNRPLVRCGDTLYYGNMADPYVIKMEIKSNVLVGKQRILVPLGVGEAQADVVRQLKITQQ